MTRLGHEPGQPGSRDPVLSNSAVNIAVPKYKSFGPIISLP